eukprot:52661_1
MFKLTEMVAGGVSGVVSRIIIAPLDVVKIRLQLESSPGKRIPVFSGMWPMFKTVFQEEGFISLWRGNSAAMVLWAGYDAAQFSIYGTMLRNLETLGAGNSKSMNHFIAGGIAGGGATVVTYPLEIIRTAFAAQGIPPRFKTMREFVTYVLRSKGVRGFYTGMSMALVQIVPQIGLAFVFYEAFLDVGLRLGHCLVDFRRDFRRDFRPNPQPSNQAFYTTFFPYFAGFASGILSKIAVFPCDTIKKRMQTVTVLQHRYGGATWKIDMKWNRYHILSLYQGLVPTCLKTGIGTGITFGVYEWANATMKNL